MLQATMVIQGQLFKSGTKLNNLLVIESAAAGNSLRKAVADVRSLSSLLLLLISFKLPVEFVTL